MTAISYDPNNFANLAVHGSLRVRPQVLREPQRGQGLGDIV